jgi:PAS domain S-box-containing protein
MPMIVPNYSITDFFPPPSDAQDIAMPTVLIVDDNPAMCLILETVLVSSGYDIQTADSGAKAKAMLQTQFFDVVVTDIGMPIISGIDLLNDLQRTAPDTSVLLMTGLPSVDTATRALQGGAFDYMLKPITAEDILRAVRRAAGMKLIKTQKRHLEVENRAFRLRLEQTVEKRNLALNVSESRLEGILAVAPMGIYVIDGGIIQDVNPAFCAMLGYHKNELLFHNERMAHCSDEERDGVRTAFEQAVAAAGLARMATPMRHKDGSLRYIHLIAAPVNGHAVRNGPVTMVATDITDQLQLEAELDQTRIALYQNGVSAATTGAVEASFADRLS